MDKRFLVNRIHRLDIELAEDLTLDAREVRALQAGTAWADVCGHLLFPFWQAGVVLAHSEVLNHGLASQIQLSKVLLFLVLSLLNEFRCCIASSKGR